MGFNSGFKGLILLLGLPILERQRNFNTRNKLKIYNIVEDLTAHQKTWLDHTGDMDMNRLPRLAVQYRPYRRRDAWRPRRSWKEKDRLEL